MFHIYVIKMQTNTNFEKNCGTECIFEVFIKFS